MSEAPTPVHDNRLSASRFTRFSIHTLLIAMTVFAILCASWANSARRQKQAVAEIESVYGRVFYDFNEYAPNSFTAAGTSHLPYCMLSALGTDYFHTVLCVDLNAPSITDATLQSVGKLAALRNLYICNAHVTNAGLTHLSNLTRLQRLVIVSEVIDDAGMAHLKAATALEDLEIHLAPVSDAGIDHLKTLHCLKRLWLSETNITEEGIKELERALPNCEIIF